MKNNKGFTLIEILAVIIILGILMVIAVPAVSKYIVGSRDFSFAKTVDKYIEIAMEEITTFEYSASNEKYTYYIPTKCLDTDNSTKNSSYGELQDSYVVVTFKNGQNYYYYTGRDDSGHGFELTYRKFITESNLKTDLDYINTDIGIGDRSEIVIYSDSCDKTSTKKTAVTKVKEDKLQESNILEVLSS